MDDILSLCGPGTYVVSGCSGSGKNAIVRTMIEGFLDQQQVNNAIIISSTAKLSDDYDYLSDRIRTIKKYTVLEDMQGDLEKIKAGVEEAKAVSNKMAKLYRKKNPVIIQVNDFIGAINANHIHSPLLQIASKARWLGIYMILCCQHVTAISKGIYSNSRAIVTLDKNSDNLKTLKKYVPEAMDIERMISHNKKPHHFCILPLDAELGAVIGSGCAYMPPVEYKGED